MDEQGFLLEDYKLKIGYINGHFDRMWTRFNYFVTIQSGLVGFLLVSGSADLSPAALPFVFAEIALSVLWWVFGAQDRALVTIYRGAVQEVAKQLSATKLTSAAYERKYVGYTKVVDEGASDQERPAAGLNEWNPVEWRSHRMSITRLAAYVPLFALATWLLVAILILAQPDVDWPVAGLDGALASALLPIAVVALCWVVILMIWAFINSGKRSDPS